MFRLLRAVKSSGPVENVQVFTQTTPFKEMVPTSHLAITAKAGAGLSTFLRLVAHAANTEARPVLFVGRVANESTDLFSGMNLMHSVKFMCGGHIFRSPDDLAAWKNKVWEAAKETAATPNAVIILDDVPGLDDIKEVQSLIRQGAQVINSAPIFPDKININTTFMGFCAASEEPSGVFSDVDRKFLPIGRAVREGFGVPRTYVEVVL